MAHGIKRQTPVKKQTPNLYPKLPNHYDIPKAGLDNSATDFSSGIVLKVNGQEEDFQQPQPWRQLPTYTNTVVGGDTIDSQHGALMVGKYGTIFNGSQPEDVNDSRHGASMIDKYGSIVNSNGNGNHQDHLYQPKQDIYGSFRSSQISNPSIEPAQVQISLNYNW